METIWLALRQRDGLLALNEIRIGPNQIVVLPHVPFDYHFTIHDADGEHSEGVIHARLNPKKGKAVSYPGAEPLGDSRGVLSEQVIPAFAEIRGVVSLSGAARPATVSVAALAEQARPMSQRQLRRTVITLKAVADMIGWDLLLVEPGNASALQVWSEHATGVRLLSKGMPWLVLATFGAETES